MGGLDLCCLKPARAMQCPYGSTAERGLGAEHAAKILGGARRDGKGWKCRCPAHDDRTPSLHLSDREDGGLLAHCFRGCPQDRVIDGMRAHGIDVAPPTEFSEARVLVQGEGTAKTAGRSYARAG